MRGRHEVYAPLVGQELKDKEGRTPLMVAVYTGNIDDVQILLKAGVNIEAKDSNGLTPLLVATYKGNAKVLGALIKAGADIEAKDKEGKTAKEYATELATARDDKELLALIEAASKKQKNANSGAA